MTNNKSDNKKLVYDFFEYINQNRLDQAFDLVDENVVWWVPGQLSISGFKTKEEYFRIIKALKENFPKGFNMHVIASFEEETRVSVEVESQGEHISGRHYNNRYHYLFEVTRNKITEVKESNDILNLYDLLLPKVH
jgi:ketosteroid isomerase-like protein